ncbi:chromate resistance protein ChrB domain-containing protein [Janibacter melonis]|uniref:chromate resistance protein ChrB domain-containing protein n=1 Tax=Janibacter melonis TaxID=262209 RepID=UPI002095CB88|nr:chromate resistance protein ChrB domain-containing protein [Janibacter melonis]
MKWATRAGIHIDRASSAWLIRRFVDPDAEFIFVDDPEELDLHDATPFDMRGVDYGHHGADCTFETILRRHDLSDPVLWRIAGIIHEADLEDEAYDAPEAPGLDAALRGLSMTQDDPSILTLSGPLFDGLYELYRRGYLLGAGSLA